MTWAENPIMCRVTRPETTVLIKACLQGWPLAGTWKLGFWEGSHHPQNWWEGPTMLKLFAQRWFTLNSCLPSESLEFWYAPGTGCLCGQTPNKPPGPESLMSFRGRCFTTAVATRLEELNVSCVTPRGKDSWKLVPSFFWISPHVLFPLADFALCPFSICRTICCVLRVLLANHWTWEWSWDSMHIYLEGRNKGLTNVQHERKSQITPRVLTWAIRIMELPLRRQQRFGFGHASFKTLMLH